MSNGQIAFRENKYYTCYGRWGTKNTFNSEIAPRHNVGDNHRWNRHLVEANLPFIWLKTKALFF